MAKCYRAELVGAFGNPIDENPTGVMEEAAFAHAGLNYRYLTVKVNKEDLEAAMNGVKAFQMKGVNLTIPHKVEVLKYLDELSEAASIIGAVNMVINRDGHLWGENTDGKGFLMSLKNEGVSPEGKSVTILGAGGAARAISVECALAGARKITIINIDKEQGGELTQLINQKTNAKTEFMFWDHPVSIPADTDILVNATSVGLYPNSLFLQNAAARGAKTINGLGMLVNQGALNFTLWTGAEAPAEVMMDTLKKEFGLM